MADENRPFVIPVRRPWLLLILPIVALLYFLAVVILNVMNYRIRGVTNEMLALVGVGLFALVILIELPFLLRRRAPREEPDEPAAYAQSPAAVPYDGSRNGWDDEILATGESQQGLSVLEYSSPAKSRNSNAVYTKTYVPVTPAHLLRVESLVADAHDL